MTNKIPRTAAGRGTDCVGVSSFVPVRSRRHRIDGPRPMG